MRCPTLSELPPPPSGKTGWPWTQASPQPPDQMPDGAEWPKISIVTPNYNYGQFIEETIRSVLLQGYPNLEYIVIDGASTDDSVEILKKYEPWLSYWVSEKDKGQSNAINKGFNMATGNIFNWLNSDDVFCQNALKNVAKTWINNPNCHFLTGDGQYVNLDINDPCYYVKPSNYSFADLLQIYANKYLPQPSVFFSSIAWQEVNGLNENLSYSMDLDLWLRLRSRFRMIYLPCCLSILRSQPINKTTQDGNVMEKEINQVILSNLSQVNLITQVITRQRMSYFKASNMCKIGLKKYFDGEHEQCYELFWQSSRINLLIIATPTWVSLAIRLFLPKTIQTIFLSRI